MGLLLPGPWLCVCFVLQLRFVAKSNGPCTLGIIFVELKSKGVCRRDAVTQPWRVAGWKEEGRQEVRRESKERVPTHCSTHIGQPQTARNDIDPKQNPSPRATQTAITVAKSTSLAEHKGVAATYSSS